MAATIQQYSTYAIQDGTLVQSIALPSSAGTVNTPAIDLGTPNSGPFPTSGEFTVQIATGASSTNGVNVQANVALQTSQDNVTWTNTATPIVTYVTNTNVASTTNINLDPPVYRYIRAQAITSGTGNVSDQNLTIKLLL